MSLLVNRMNKRITIQKQVNGKDEEGLPTKNGLTFFRVGLNAKVCVAGNVLKRHLFKWKGRQNGGFATVKV